MEHRNAARISFIQKSEREVILEGEVKSIIKVEGRWNEEVRIVHNSYLSRITESAFIK